MKCPMCGNNDTHIIDSREIREGRKIRRNRICKSCGKMFRTYEVAEEEPLIIVNNDGSREKFSKETLINSILNSANKLNYSATEASATVNKVYEKFASGLDSEVQIEDIINETIELLKKQNKAVCLNYYLRMRPESDIDNIIPIIKKINKG